MPYKRLFYHFIWATKGRLPSISPEIETIMFPAIYHKVDQLGGFTYAVDGVEDHVHLAVSIPVNMAVSEFVKQVKSGSSYLVGKAFPALDDPFRWQPEYGVFTFAESDLDHVIRYIEMQKQHHAVNTIISQFEQMD